MTSKKNYLVIKDMSEAEYLEGQEYKVWNDDYVKSACDADSSHFVQFPEFLSSALEWKMILEDMYPSVKNNCLRSYGYYTERPLHYAIDRYIRRLISEYIILETDANIELSVQLYWPKKAFVEAYKDAYHRLPEYRK